ncbi:MAG: sugar transferase [Lachnospiraceae bacterium]|nr:sugar transferase [Lachnospiraceae bacterium]
MYRKSSQGWLKHLDFIILDEVALQLAFIIAFIIRHDWGNPYLARPYLNLAIAFAVTDFLASALFNTMHGVIRRGFYVEAASTFKQVVLVLAGMSIYMFSSQSGEVYSRVTVYLTALFHFFIGYTIRICWKPVARNMGRGKDISNMILVAEEAKAIEVIKRAKEAGEHIYNGLVLTDRNAVGEEIEGIRVVADLDNAADYICREWVDEVFIYPTQLTDIDMQDDAGVPRSVEGFIADDFETFSRKDYKEGKLTDHGGTGLSLFIEQCRQMAITMHIRLPIANIGEQSFIERVGGIRVLTTAYNYASPMQLTMKRILDVIGGLTGCILTLFVMLILGPAIKKESPGPLLFKQVRIGKNGKRFTCYKIRSMYLDAEERKKELMEQNRVADGMMFKMDFDPRIIGNKIVDGKQVTGIGEFIRSHSLDEFPQFFNVLMGQMSLVGTRPPTVDEWEKYKYHHRARLAVKPGITGMWQVSGRSSITDFEEVVRLDTEYIQNWSIGLDIRILIKTIGVVLKKDGAM